MSKIEELIKKKCPDGVEYRPLLDVADVLYGYPCSSKDFNETANGLPLARIRDVLSGESSVYTSENIPEKYLLSKGDLLVGMDGNFHVGRWNMESGVLCQRVCKFTAKKESILDGWLGHILKPIIKKIEVSKPAGTVNHLLDKDIKAIRIPVPPLEIQQEIVDALNSFMELETELKIELEARKRQYEYYCDQLLSFKSDDVKYTTLAGFGKLIGGLTGKTKDDFTDGNAPFISYMNVFNNIAVDFSADDKVKINETEKQHSLEYGDILFTGSSETLEECGMSSVVTQRPIQPTYLNSFCFILRPVDNNILLPEFSKFLFRSNYMRKQIRKTASGVTRFNISKERMKKIIIPIPSINYQEKVISILDNFNHLTTDSSKGLPAEIQARHKQYEYYRDKLLTFKEKVVK